MLLETSFRVKELAHCKEFWLIHWLLSWYMKSVFIPCPGCEFSCKPTTSFASVVTATPSLLRTHGHPLSPHCYSLLHNYINFVSFHLFKLQLPQICLIHCLFYVLVCFLTHKDSTLTLINYNIFHFIFSLFLTFIPEMPLFFDLIF